MNLGLGSFSGGIFMVLWWVLIIVAVVVIIKWLVDSSSGAERDDKTALDILKQRYAKGEITKEEFQSKKKDIEQ